LNAPGEELFEGDEPACPRCFFLKWRVKWSARVKDEVHWVQWNVLGLVVRGPPPTLLLVLIVVPAALLVLVQVLALAL
jgi:hypothetical protein